MLIYFLTFNIYKYFFPFFLIYSFDTDDTESSKRHVVLLSLIFLLKSIDAWVIKRADNFLSLNDHFATIIKSEELKIGSPIQLP